MAIGPSEILICRPRNDIGISYECGGGGGLNQHQQVRAIFQYLMRCAH